MRKKAITEIPKYTLSHEVHNVSVRHVQGDTNSNRQGIHGAHRDDYYLFLFQQGGESRLMVDFKEVELRGPCIYYVLPGQVHYYISTMQVTGWLVAANEVCIDQAFTSILEELSLVLPVNVEEADAQRLTMFATLLQSLCGLPADTLQHTLISHLISAYAGIIAGIYRVLPENELSKASRPVQVAREFQKMVRHHYLKLKRPGQYAEALHITAAYLNECVKSVTGMPVSHWIQQQIVLEAKRMLYHGKLSVKEVAYYLGYHDHAYFSRLFLKVTGTTPAAFRKSHV